MLHKLQIEGIVKIVIAIVLYVFANAHSPHMSFGQMITNLNGWVFSEPVYYLILGLAAMLAIIGLLNILNSFKEHTDDKEDVKSDDSIGI